MSIFGDNITSEIPFEVVLQTKFNDAVRKAAALSMFCWAGRNNINRGVFEYMAKWGIRYELELVLTNDKRYEFLNQDDVNFKYQQKGKTHERVWVSTVMLFKDKEKNTTMSHVLEETILLNHNAT